MATLTKSITENYINSYKATWSLSVSASDKTISASSFTAPVASLSAGFTYSGKNRGFVSFNYEIHANSATGTRLAYGTFARPTPSSGNVWSSMTSGTKYNISEVNNGYSTIQTNTVFNSSNATTNKVNLYLVQKITSVGSKSSTSTPEKANSFTTSNSYSSNMGKIATLTLNAPPSCSYSQVYTGSSSNPSTTFYQNLSELKVDITNCIAQYEGNVSNVSFTIGKQTVTHNGGSNCTLSLVFYDYGTYTPTVTITDSRGQVTSYNLNPITIIEYQKPSANIIKIERINSDSKLPDDEGTNALLTVKFYFFDSLATLDIPFVRHYNGTSWVQSTCTWYQTRNSTTKALSNAVNWNSPPNTSPVTLYCHVSDSFISTESYDFEVYPYDSIGTGEGGYGTIASATLSPAYYTVDFYAGGHGVAFGTPAVDEEFKVAMPATFTSIINIAQDSNDSSDYALCVHNKNAGNFADFSVDWDGKVTARGGLSVPYGTVSISGATTINNTLTVNNNTTIHGNVNIDSGKKYQINGTALQNAVQLVTGGNSTAASIGANTYGTVITTATIPSGYIVVGVARITSNHYSALRMTGFDLDLDGKITVQYHNASSTNFTDVTVTTQVACIKQVL